MKQEHLIASGACDIAFAVTWGKVTQDNHFLLVLGLLSLTGSWKIIDSVHKLG